MMMQTEHTNIPSTHVNAKGSVGGRRKSGYDLQTEHKNIRSKPRVQLEEEREVDLV